MESWEVFVECDCDDCCKPYIGSQGRVGYQGLVEVGVQGNRGYQMDPFVHYGFQGPQGFQGLDVKGQDGFRGPQGLSEQGPQGTIGNQGLLGVGPVGVSGSAGTQGPQGLSIIGVQGDPGAQGNPIDATGPQGPVSAAIIILPFFDRGMQVFSFPTSSALFSSVVLPRGRYVELMTVSITSTSACTGNVKAVGLSESFRILTPGATVTLTIQFTDYLTPLGTIVSWTVTADQPVTVTWTRLILRSNY